MLFIHLLTAKTDESISNIYIYIYILLLTIGCLENETEHKNDVLSTSKSTKEEKLNIKKFSNDSLLFLEYYSGMNTKEFNVVSDKLENKGIIRGAGINTYQYNVNTMEGQDLITVELKLKPVFDRDKKLRAIKLENYSGISVKVTYYREDEKGYKPKPESRFCIKKEYVNAIINLYKKKYGSPNMISSNSRSFVRNIVQFEEDGLHINGNIEHLWNVDNKIISISFF